MICNICGKNQATVHLTEIVDGQMTELHICEACAKEKSVEMEQQFGLSDLLAGLADFGKHLDGKDLGKIQCPVCKLTYDDFKKIGRLGCSNCYSSFSQYLIPLLKRIHGSSSHTGKAPAGMPKVEAVKKDTLKTKVKEQPAVSLLQLKEKLQAAIKVENFEEAAALRDKIRDLEKKEKSSNASVKDSGRKRKKA